MKGKLYLIPATLGESDVHMVIPSNVIEIVKTLDEFIVEQEKTARHFLKSIGYESSLDSIILHPLNKHTSHEDILIYLDNAIKGKNIGLLSEAGCPCIADPGNIIVQMAHQKQIQVVPLVGPSSIYLSLMASGFNGQNFAFNGYLPIEKNERVKKIKELEEKNPFPEEVKADKFAGSKVAAGNIEQVPLLCGLSAGGIREIKSCQEIIEEIMKELEKLQ